MDNTIKGRLKSIELADKICDFIVKNRLKAGDVILSENQLCERFSLSRVTVRQAIAYLVDKGILYKQKGKGTFVANSDILAADNVRYGLSNTIALVVDSINNSYNASIARGVEDMVREHGLFVIYCSTDGNPSREEEGINNLIAAGIGGLIISPAESMPLPSFLQKICREFGNLVIVNNSVLGINVDIVASDDEAGGYIATKYLIDSGHRRIAHLKGPMNVMNARDRESGYRKALNEFGIPVDENLIKGKNTYTEEEAFINMKEILELPEQERPSAVFAANDNMAVGACKAIEEYRMSVPKDISVVGYGNLDDVRLQGYNLTTVKQNPYKIGKIAGKLVLQSMKKESFYKEKRKILLHPELIIGNSTEIITGQ